MVFDDFNRKRLRRVGEGYPPPEDQVPVDLTGAPHTEKSWEQLPVPPAPTPPRRFEEPHVSTEKVQAVMETILEEKLMGFEKKIEGLEKMKESIKRQISELQGNVDKVSYKIDLLEKTLSERIGNYGKNFEEISVELRALHKVFQTILPTFTENIRELRSIVDRARVRHIKTTVTKFKRKRK